MTWVGELAFAAAMTVALEGAVAASRGHGRAALWRVAALNLATNPLMNLGIVAWESAAGALVTPAALAGIEGVVVLVEGAAYRRILAGCEPSPFRLSLAANAVSYLAGAALFGF